MDFHPREYTKPLRILIYRFSGVYNILKDFTGQI